MKKMILFVLFCIPFLTACSIQAGSSTSSESPAPSDTVSIGSGDSLPVQSDASSVPNTHDGEWREETFTLIEQTITITLPFYIHLELYERGVWLIFDEAYLPGGMVTTPNDMLGGGGFYNLGGLSLSDSGKIPLEMIDENTYNSEFYDQVYVYTRMDSIRTNPGTFYELGDYFVWSGVWEEPFTRFVNRENGLVINFYHETDTAELKTLFETIVLSAQVQ